jgi:hypothetical protein
MPFTGSELVEFAKREFPDVNAVVISCKEVSDLSNGTYFFKNRICRATCSGPS